MTRRIYKLPKTTQCALIYERSPRDGRHVRAAAACKARFDSANPPDDAIPERWDYWAIEPTGEIYDFAIGDAIGRDCPKTMTATAVKAVGASRAI